LDPLRDDYGKSGNMDGKWGTILLDDCYWTLVRAAPEAKYNQYKLYLDEFNTIISFVILLFRRYITQI
jgi:hypothetical protein